MEEELLDSIASCLTVLLKKFGDAAMPYVDSVMPEVAVLLEGGRSAQEHRIGVCIMDDILEHSPAGGARLASQCLPVLLAKSSTKVRRTRGAWLLCLAVVGVAGNPL